MGDVNDSSSRRLVDADAGGVYANGHVLFVRQTQVLAQPFDAERLELKGSPFQIADGVFSRGNYLVSLSASNAAFAFRAGAASFARQITWIDRKGNQVSTVGDSLAHIDGVSWSPDRSQIAFFERGPTSSDLWLLDTRRGVVSRFTEDADEDIFPLWARDGNRIIYTVVQKGQVAIYQKQVGSNRRELLIAPQAEEILKALR